MHVIHASNVNDAFALGLEHILAHGVPQPSRNGPVLVAPTPVTTVYSKPWERVLFSPLRDANPFFHVMESLWMLAGRNDLETPKFFNSRFGAYSDDGIHIRGAYGHRWRKWFGYDQLHAIMRELREDPDSRRCVLAMWDAGNTGYWYDVPGTLSVDDPCGDLLAETKDKPCNTHIYFRINQGKLDMTVCCRSNDLLWGVYGANAVHMSFLQEYMAVAIGVQMGTYYQISNNFHLYTDVVDADKALALIKNARTYDLYDDYASEGSSGYSYMAANTPLVRSVERFDEEVKRFFDDPCNATFDEPFLQLVAKPMYQAWDSRISKRSDGFAYARTIDAPDWAWVCKEWIHRREAQKAGQ